MTGAIKGRILQHNAQVALVDISHEVSPYNYNEAVYFVKSAYPHFPAFTWHIILVNVFDGPANRCLLAHHNGHYFAAPDNGLLPMIFDANPETVVHLPLPNGGKNLLDWADVMAQAIAAMQAGQAFYKLGTEAEGLVEKTSLKPNFGDNWIEGRIIFIDRFENVIVNITRGLFDQVGKGRSFYIEFTKEERVNKISDHYGAVAEGDKLAFFNTAGLLEIAVNKGNAAGLFGLQAIQKPTNRHFAHSRQFYHTVRVQFQ